MDPLQKFKLWSSHSPEASEAVSPEIPWRSFAELTEQERHDVLLHFRRKNYLIDHPQRGSFYGDLGVRIADDENAMIYAINSMNSLYKKECYARRTLEEFSVENVSHDFISIFIHQSVDVVFELISLYAFALIELAKKITLFKEKDETKESYEARQEEFLYRKLDAFILVANDIFDDYRVNVRMTRIGLMPTQDVKIIEEIYEPVLKVLSASKWQQVNRELRDAFSAYSKSTPDGYSESMTHCYAAVQAVLQELTGKRSVSIKDGIRTAIAANLLPNDPFSASAFGEMLSVFEQLRMQHGDAHPKQAYADEKSARLMLNLTMVYLQHCLI